MAATAKGWTYPLPGDPITDYPALAQSLAVKLEAEQDISGATIAAIAAQVGGGAEGKRALLSCGADPHKLALEYDPVLGKWVGPETWYPLLRGSDAQAGSGVGSGSVVELGTIGRAPLLPHKVFRDAGLLPQARIAGLFGMVFTGATTTRIVNPEFLLSNLAATVVHTGATGLNSAAITAPDTAPTLIQTTWSTMVGGAAITDYMIPSYYLYGTGTGTYSYAARHVAIGVRWISA